MMNGIVDPILAKAIAEEWLRRRRREPVDLGPFWSGRSKQGAEGLTGKPGLVHALQSAARAVVAYLA